MVGPAWTDGDAYDAYVGRWSRAVAVEFLRWLARPPGGRWLDVGCGTGALTATILARADPAEVVGVDPAAPFLDQARASVVDRRVSFRRADARSLPLPDDSCEVVVSGLALNFVPEPDRAVTEWVRVAAPGATVAAYVWDYSGGMQMIHRFWEVAASLDPAVAAAGEAGRSPLCRPEPLRQTWLAGGLSEVEVTAVEVPTVFDDFDDYWRPFLGGQGPAPGYVMSLAGPARTALRNRLQAVLGGGPGGRIELTARAWAVRGRAGEQLT